MVASKENDMIPQENPARLDAVRKIAPFISLYGEVIERTGQVLPQQQERAAIALAVMTHDPQNLRHLSELWGTPEEQLRVSIRDSYYDPVVKQVGFEIFDRQKAKEDQEKQERERSKVKIKKERKEKKPVKELVDHVFSNLPNDLISPHQQRILEYTKSGMSNEEIGEIIGIKSKSVAVQLVFIRRKLEPFIKNAGLVRVASYGINTLTSAASERALESEKILRIYYTRPDIAEAYLRNRKLIDEHILNQGYILLTDREKVSKREYFTLLGATHRENIIRKNGRAYVSPDYLEKFKAKQIKKATRETPPTPDHVLLARCNPLPPDHPDYGNLYRGVLRLLKLGRIPYERKGRRWYVKKEDVQAEIERFLTRKGYEEFLPMLRS